MGRTERTLAWGLTIISCRIRASFVRRRIRDSINPQVGASDKASGKSTSVKITSDKGRLSDDEIERMVAEAEQFAAEDAAAREAVEARNALEGYLYQLKVR